MAYPVNNFTVIESIYGRFIVNRHCTFQAEHMIKSGEPHIQPELINILAIVGSLPPDCVVVDAGANIGLVAIPMAEVIKEKRGTVYAFEVQRMLYYALCGSAALNDLDNLHVKREAVGRARGSIKVPHINYGHPQDFGLLSLVDQDHNYSFETIDLIAIDDLGLPRLDFLKIDVEGMEEDVLAGARRMIETHSPWCWVEYWKCGPEAIKTAFLGLEYKFYCADEMNLLCAPVSRLKDGEIKGLTEV